MIDYKDMKCIYEAEQIFEWRKWIKEIPSIQFSPDWKVTVIPPFGGAVVRFLIHRKAKDKRVSVYLDCYSKLGCVDYPYWEVYPFENDCGRCLMEDTETLIAMIESGLNEIEKENTDGKG